MTLTEKITFPINPLEKIFSSSNEEIQRRTVVGVLESYNSNYDVLAEAIQNSLDAIEDAFLSDLPAPYEITVNINLKENWISVLDTGIGMEADTASQVFAPNATFKNNPVILKKRGKQLYRGFKGVGLTFLAYGTDDISLHTKSATGEPFKGRMQFGREWATGERSDPALITEDRSPSPIDNVNRGTYVKVQLSNKTRPKRLSSIAPNIDFWAVILRTRTAIGQINLFGKPLVNFKVTLSVTDSEGKTKKKNIEPSFLLPHHVARKPEFRFLDVVAYHLEKTETPNIPPSYRRQDAIYLTWDKNRIFDELTAEQKKKYQDEFELYSPTLYAFFPYQTTIWNDINESLIKGENRKPLGGGLILAVNRQRLADQIKIEATRFTNLAPTLFVLIHFDDAKPDQGRKTVQDEVVELAKDTADRVLQYCQRQQVFLKPRGDEPTPDQRDVELNHEQWKLNVQTHSQHNPLNIPPVTYQSKPLTEQDVVGLFNQLCALDVIPGIKIFATSQIQTYDSLVNYGCRIDDVPGIKYISQDKNPLGLMPYLLGNRKDFTTRTLTLEFKTTIDGLIDEIENRSTNGTKKDFGHIDICVCWSTISEKYKGYTLEAISHENIDERKYPGATHVLSHDGYSTGIQVIMLEKVVEMIISGKIKID